MYRMPAALSRGAADPDTIRQRTTGQTPLSSLRPDDANGLPIALVRPGDLVFGGIPRRRRCQAALSCIEQVLLEAKSGRTGTSHTGTAFHSARFRACYVARCSSMHLEDLPPNSFRGPTALRHTDFLPFMFQLLDGMRWTKVTGSNVPACKKRSHILSNHTLQPIYA